MKAPFVSRATYDAVIAGHVQRAELLSDMVKEAAARLVAEREAHEREMVASEARYAELLALHRALVSPKEAAAVEGRPPKPPSDVQKVIREQSMGPDGQTDHALARHLRSYAAQLKRDGLNDDAIIGKLVGWFNTEAMYDTDAS